MFRSVLFVLMGLVVCTSAFSAETEEVTTVMGEVVVTATRQAEELTSVPANVTIIDREKIEQSPAQNIPELLRFVPGVVVNDLNGNGRHYTVDLRGFGETASLNTLVLVDGRRINQADLSGTDWSLIPRDRVERIEIVRGGRGSVLYGDNATGGVVNIITRKGGKEFSADVGTSAGSYDALQGDLAVSGSFNKLTMAVNGNYRESNGYRDNADTEAEDFGINLGYEVSEKLSLYLNSGYHDDETGMPGGLFKSSLDGGLSRKTTLSPDNFADTEDWYVQGGLQFYLTDSSYVELDVSKRDREAKFFFASVWGDYTGTTELETRTVSPLLVINEDIAGYQTKMLFGVDYEKAEEDIHNDASGFVSTFDMSKKSTGYFTHADIALNEQLNVSAGYRKERADFKFKWIEGSTSEKASIDEDLYTLGVNYQPITDSSVYFSYSKSYRSPVIDEFFNFFSNTVNSDLKAQTSDDFELGARIQLDSGLSFGINFFHIVTKDEIFYNPVSANENLDGDTVRNGVELSASKNIHGFLLNGSYTFRDAEIDGGQYDGKELPNVPEHQVTLGVQKTFCERVHVGVNGTYVGERRFISDFDNNLGDQNDYFYLSGKLSYLLDNGMLYLAVNNILDEEYAEYGLDYGSEYLYPSPEINFSVGAKFRF